MSKYSCRKVASFAFVSVLLLFFMFGAGFDGIARGESTLYVGSDYTFASNIYEPIVVIADNITIDGNGYTLDVHEYYGFYLEGRSNVTIKNVNVRARNAAIHLNQSSNNNIYGNNITSHSFDGIWLVESDNNNIYGNNITNNGNGIWLDQSSHNNITQNYIANNAGGGVSEWPTFNEFSSHSSNIIIQNDITGNGLGVYMLFSSHAAVSQNNIIGNNVGIQLWMSGGHTITQNNILNNSIGILLEDAWNSAIYHNNFIDNTLQVYDRSWDYGGPESLDIWDNGYPSGGNYWSDYNGTDHYSGPDQNVTGGDGIGDTPYVIDDYNQDRYPFMNPWPMDWATVCSVWTADADGNPKVEFDPGQTVYVRWSANGMVNMTIYAPDGVTTDQEWTGLLSSGVVSFVPSHGMGIYEIDCTGARPTPIAISTFLVIPQLPFVGTVLTLVTMLAAFITKKWRSR